MLGWKVEKGVIQEVTLNDQNMIYPWGIETADASGFFSLEQHIGYRHIIDHQKHKLDGKTQQSSMQVLMPEGQWDLDLRSELHPRAITREVTLSTDSYSWHMDFVMRFRFKKEFFEEAKIADKTISHTNSNVYHLHDVREVELKGKNLSVRVAVTDLECPPNFKHYMYVRDHLDEWIVHSRFLPADDERMVIKLCNRWYKTRSIPQFLTDKILTYKIFKDYLYYHSERSPYKNRLMRLICPNAFPLGKLLPDQKFWVKSECTFHV